MRLRAVLPTTNLLPMNDELVIPPLPVRIFLCVYHWKTWRECRTLDRAAVLLINSGPYVIMGIRLKEISDEKWREIFKPSKSSLRRMIQTKKKHCQE